MVIRRLKAVFILLTIFVVLITTLFIILFERFAVPVGVETAKRYAVTKVNTAVNRALGQAMTDKGIKSDALYSAYFNEEGRLTYLEVNAPVVNEVCADMAQLLSEELNGLTEDTLWLPLGVTTGVNLLSHVGPKLPLYITPVGSSVADYQTDMESGGIGQVNFKVWLVVNTEVAIVNPLINKHISITRKLMLVNTVFSGEVPQAFYGEKNTNQ